MNDLIQKGDMDIKILVLGMVSTNCYIISNHETKEAIIIDPADKSDRIKQYITEAGLNIVGIFLTHGHFDHIFAATELTSYYHTKLYASKEEKSLLNDANMNCSAGVGRPFTLKADVYLNDQELIHLAGMQLKVIHTPGHTAGSVCYHIMNHSVLLSGDTLFLESVGRTDLPTGNGAKIVQSINEKLMVLDDNIIVYPGHGDATSIAYERENNPYLTGWE